MGHQIEYLAAVPGQAVRQWVAGLDGFYCSEPSDRLLSWEGALHSGGTFWAHIDTAACNFSLAMKYTGLYFEQPLAVDFARRFEAEFWAGCGSVTLLRLDEYLFNEWQRDLGDWEDFANPSKHF